MDSTEIYNDHFRGGLSYEFFGDKVSDHLHNTWSYSSNTVFGLVLTYTSSDDDHTQSQTLYHRVISIDGG